MGTLVWLWVWAVMWQWLVLISGGLFAGIEVWNRFYGKPKMPRKLQGAIVLACLVWASFLAWRAEYVRAQHLDVEIEALAALRNKFADEIDKWWAVCGQKEKTERAEKRVDVIRTEIYGKLRKISLAEADQFHLTRADEHLPEDMKRKKCADSEKISASRHRLDRLGDIIQRLRQKRLG